MKKKDSLLRRSLYRLLPFKNYLWVLSKIYLYSYRAGMLKSNSFFEYQHFLDKIIKKGDTCIDIGANLGYFTVPLSKLAGREGHVYSVEPVKPVLSVLRSNAGQLKNVTIMPYALGQENKTIRLGNNSLSRKGYIASGSHFVLDKDKAGEVETDIEFEAEMRRPGELFSGLDRLDFIKCDVEGYEIYILPEMEPLIMKHRPLLMVETSGEKRVKLLDFFDKCNYVPFILKDGLMHKAGEHEKRDLIFIPSEKTGSFRDYISN